MSDGLIWGLSSLGAVLLVFFVLAIRFPDVVRDFFAGIEELDVTIKGFKVRRAVRPAGQAVRSKEGHEPDSRSLKDNLRTLPSTARILWVDDNPCNNKDEIEAFRKLGIRVETVRSNDEAEMAVQSRQYDLIISDIHRPESPTAGLELPERLSKVTGQVPPVCYYVGEATSPLTPDGHPVTDAPSELFSVVAQSLQSD